ncbi:MAG: T9SS type A sorting domain-containing protein [Paludibacteraceae bacterium]|nr:T9SS type A sorting domain-containing protein [Paludibacteraceae bacterium]
MKKLTLLLLGLTLCSALWAYEGESCTKAIEVEAEYSGTFAEGEYWFTSTTAFLPLTIYYYPEDTTAQAPEIWIDLTCTPGVYEDSLVAKMLLSADQYGLSFPMKEVPSKEYDDKGRMFYRVTYDKNYRDMLYNQGVTYAIPAYVRVVNHGQAAVDIISKSINAQCSEYVNTLGLNTSLRVAPEDSVYVHLWPIGEWINKQYRITWEGEGSLDFYDGTTCRLTKDAFTRDKFTMPKDTITMKPSRTSEWINDIYQTELYVRLYAEKEGVLKIEEYQEISLLKEVILTYGDQTFKAMIDHETLTITAVFPQGATRANMLKSWQNATYVYDAYNGEKPSLNRQGTELTFGKKVYILKNSAITSTGNVDATLKSITIDGVALENFLPQTAVYNDVEVTTTSPIVAATANASSSTVEITQVTSIPGKATITVTAEAGNTQTYTLNLIAGRSKDATLKEVTIDGKAFTLTAGEVSYRTQVSKLPVVTAIANDEKATIVIEQAKGVPGFAQIRVTAEAGNVETYTFNFVMDPRFEVCLGSTPRLELNQTTNLTTADADAVLNIPVKQWTNNYVRFVWSQASNLKVYLGTSCFFDPKNPDETLIDSFTVSRPKGEDITHYDLRPDKLKELAKRSLDGTLYVRFNIPEDGQLSLTEWTENCHTESQFIELNTTTEIPANARLKYKIYIPDWMNKDVKLTWKGDAAVTVYVADACDFYLTHDNIHVLAPSPYSLAAGEDSVWVEKNTTLFWSYYDDEDYIFLRFVNQLPGTLTVEPKVEASTGLHETQKTNISWKNTTNGVEISTEKNQKVNIFNVTGVCVKEIYLLSSQPQSVHIPKGVYVMQGEDGETVKLINY